MKRAFVFIVILICWFNVLTLTAVAESPFFEGLRVTGEGEAGYQALPAKGGASAFISEILGSGVAPIMAGVMGMLLLAYGGFIWMMSRGREQEVERAKIIVTNTLIAMFVIFSAWAIVKLIMPLWKLVTEKLAGV